ncbi:MAG TPA: gamma-glutamyl-gamma-aminobutyrate hydrolase family protein [Anaerolineae bacterium]|jgi:GMP synthase-like glutamine amidotransferase|nr:gamma-glutamyl-gamma-aminobutyrate hydrolase family protein [Anaerolineae bacterium]
MAKILVIVENDDVIEEQNLAQITRELVVEKIDTVIFEPIGGFPRELPTGAAGLVVGGGLPSVNDPKGWISSEAELVRQAAAAQVPILGICFGHQLIAKAFGEEVVRREPRVGFADIKKVEDDPLFSGLPSLWRSPIYHRDRVESVPEGFKLIATSDYCAIQAMRHTELPIWTVQFHPEIGFGINDRFSQPVGEWSDESAFEPGPNRRLIDNFIEICYRGL